MEFRVLQYFLAVAREESVSGAAEFLHLSQPTLSRQLKNLEEESLEEDKLEQILKMSENKLKELL